MADQDQTDTTSQVNTPSSAFDNIFDNFLTLGGNVLTGIATAKTNEITAQANAQAAISQQQAYTALAAQNPATGPNDPAGAQAAAADRAQLFFGILPNTPTNQIIAKISYIVLGVIGVLLIVKLIRK